MEKKNKNDNINYSEIIAWSIAVLGVATNILSAYKTRDNGFGSIFIMSLALELVLVFIVFIYFYEKHKLETKISDLEKTKESLELHNNELLIKLEEKDNEIVNKNTFLLNRLSKIIVKYEQANRLNSKFCKSIPVLNAKSYRVLEILRDSENVERSISQKIIVNSINEFETGLFDSYKSYTINFLDFLTQTEALYFSSKNIDVQISSTIKLFDNPYFSIDNPIFDS